MLLQTTTRELELGLLLLVVALVALVGYWVYRDADARGMDDAGYWGAAVGVAFAVGLVIGGLVAVAVYLSTRPEEYNGGEAPFDDLQHDDDSETDPAHADLPPVPELTAVRVESASPTVLRGYARRYDDLDATGDPEALRAALQELVERGEAAETLGTEPDEDEVSTADSGSVGDMRRHLGRPQLSSEGVDEVGAEETTEHGPATEPEASDKHASAVNDDGNGDNDSDDNDATAGSFEWVEN